MKKIVYLLFLYSLVFQYAALGQLPCYTPVREDGLKYMRKGEYAKAIDQFWLALSSCDDKPDNHDLYKLIKDAQRVQVATLEDNIQQKKAALVEAESAKNKAQELELLERTARKRADDNAELAIKEGRLAESMRLALLADISRERGLGRPSQNGSNHFGWQVEQQIISRSRLGRILAVMRDGKCLANILTRLHRMSCFHKSQSEQYIRLWILRLLHHNLLQKRYYSSKLFGLHHRPCRHQIG